MQSETEELQIELDDETTIILEVMAKEKGVTPEELVQELLDQAIKEGYFDTPENITTDDPLE